MAERGEADFNDILDDWFIETLKTYKDLHVYQLEHPTQVIEWTSGKTVCVAGYSSSKNEILELQLPLKLFAEENKGLCAERDFKVVHGGFTEGPVRCLRHVPGTRCVVTNDGLTSDLQVWTVGGDDSDVIRRTGSVAGRKTRKKKKSDSEGGSRIAARHSSQVLHGAQSDDIQLTQLTSGQILYTPEITSSDPLSSLQFVSDDVFLAGCCNGNVYIADTRISDLRNPGAAVSRAQLSVQSRRCNPCHVTVSWAPALNDCIAVSGFSGLVQIYNTSGWGAELQEVQPLFEHRGHAVSSQSDEGDVFVTSQLWHPERPRTLLSAASDGSVHVWDWVDQSDADR
ncbi:hypothetical protein KUCAC02_016683 [Chaenocephalus aceratus]|nr:hypothetical protein KUCAC02_016683 [Chaenocephalus aceratus]